MTVPLLEYAETIHSQNGEDGILREIFRGLGIDKGVFCEFGAWDGKHLSNCYALYEQGWTGWYIEGDPRRFRDLARNISADRAETLCAFVATEGANSLDALLARSRLFANGVRDLDLLSIDIDSDDLAVWRGVKTMRAKVVVIEFNPTIPIDIIYENAPKGANRGNSARAIHETAKVLGYDLVAVAGANMILVDRRLPHGLQVLDLYGPEIPWGPRYFFGFDGTLLVATTTGSAGIVSAPEAFRAPWIGGVLTQPVPRLFRRYAAPSYIRILWWVVSGVRAVAISPFSLLRRCKDVLGGRLR